MQEEAFDKFIGEIVDAKGFTSVTPEVRPQLVADLKERLLDQIDRALIDALPDDKVDEFNQKLDDDTFDDVAARKFIIDAGVDTQRIAAETMLRFRDFYLNPTVES